MSADNDEVKKIVNIAFWMGATLIPTCRVKNDFENGEFDFCLCKDRGSESEVMKFLQEFLTPEEYEVLREATMKSSGEHLLDEYGTTGDWDCCCVKSAVLLGAFVDILLVGREINQQSTRSQTKSTKLGDEDETSD